MAKSKPKDEKLYQLVKSKLYKHNPIHSAYRSGLLVKKYKAAFKLKYPKQTNAYFGKTSNKEGLSRWFKEDWKSDTGKYHYTSKSSVYRPTKRVTKKHQQLFQN